MGTQPEITKGHGALSTTQASPRSDWRQLWSGIAAGIVVVATVLSGLLLASQEPGGVVPTTLVLVSGTPVAVAVPSLVPTIVPVTIIAATPATTTVTPGPSVTTTPTVVCPPQAGWRLYTARRGDTLGSIAAAFGTDAYVLIQGNCLLNTTLTAGQTLYIPPIPTRGPAPAPTYCGPPLTWMIYYVQPGDTLYGLALRYRTSVSALARANCLTSYTVHVGQPLYVPPGSFIPPPPTRIRPSATRPTPVASSTPPVPSATVPPGVTPSRTSTRVLPSPSPSEPGPSVTPPSATPKASDTPSTPTPPTDSTPSATPPPPTQTLAPPTDTAQPETATLPPPTLTLPPPTKTSPPTLTLPPPTATSGPPPPTHAPQPPTATALPPTNPAPPPATP